MRRRRRIIRLRSFAAKGAPQEDSSSLLVMRTRIRRTDGMDVSSGLEFEGLERCVLRGDQKFAGESGFGWPAAQRLFRANSRQIRIVVFLRNMREHEIPRVRIKPIRIREIFTHRMIR